MSLEKGEDLTALVDEKLPPLTEKAKAGHLHEAIEGLLSLEKQTRQAADVPSTTRVAKTIIALCFEARDLTALNNNLVLLSKRRGQIKTAIQEIVRAGITYLDELEGDSKMSLINTLRTITEGKIFIEIERARLTQILANIKEKEGDIDEAARILQEVQVETFGQMDRKEKIAYLLEQVRLCLEKNDFVRALILSNKITRKVLNEESFEELKIKFYTLMIRYHFNEKDYLEIARSYHSIYETSTIKANEEKWKHNLKMIIVYLVLSPFTNEQSDFINRIFIDKKTNELPLLRKLVKYFLTPELIQWPSFKQQYHEELVGIPEFAEQSANEEKGTNQLWIDLHKRVVEHNIRVISKYYNRISTERLSKLLHLETEQTEKFISDQVTSHSIFARIDRPAGIISFKKPQDPTDVLNEWSSNINKLLDLVETNTSSINKILDRKSVV